MVEERGQKIKLLILDVDGILTDGRIIYTDGGLETKSFNVYDGLGLVLLKRAGIGCVAITFRKSKAVMRRMKELGVEEVYDSGGDKLKVYQDLLRRHHLREEETAFIGDDLPDLPIMKRAGLAISVPEGREEVKAAAHYITRKAGGAGAVREAAEIILRAQGKWSAVTQDYRR